MGAGAKLIKGFHYENSGPQRKGNVATGNCKHGSQRRPFVNNSPETSMNLTAGGRT